MIWNKLYTGNIVSNPTSIIKRKNYNSYIVSGFKQYTAPSIIDYGYIFEINDSGQVLKSHDFPYVNLMIQRTFEINDSSYLMIANSQDSLYIIETDTSFNVKWTKSPFVNLLNYFDRFYDACFSFDKKSIAMTLESNGYNYTANIDLNGDLITHKIIDNSFGWPTCIISTQNNGYIIGTGMLYTDSNFNKINYHYYRGSLFSIVLNDDGSVVGSGESGVRTVKPDGSFVYELYIIKADSAGNTTYYGINEAKLQNTGFSIYPNPTTNELHIVQSAISNYQLVCLMLQASK